MIKIKKGTLERISDWQEDSIYVLTDFDRTITIKNSESSWGILSKSGLVPKEYAQERQALYNHYRPLEIDETLDYETKNKLMIEWWSKHIQLLVKYQLSEDVVNQAAKSSSVMSFRKGAREFLESMRDRNIPVIIISAGIGNFIEQFLIKYNCYFDNIHIVSNFLKFEKGIAAGIFGKIIHSLNKNTVSLPEEVKRLIEKRKNIILLGDYIADIQMTSKETQKDALKIGFLDEKIEENLPYYEEQFDVVGTDDTGFDELFEKIPILKK